MTTTSRAAAPIDYDSLMHANLKRVFGERDPDKRLAAIQELYAADATLNESQATVKGHAEINNAVTELLAGLPTNFQFRSLAPAMGHHGIGVLRWGSDPQGSDFAVTGMDVAHFQDGVIRSLYVFLIPKGA